MVWPGQYVEEKNLQTTVQPFQATQPLTNSWDALMAMVTGPADQYDEVNGQFLRTVILME